MARTLRVALTELREGERVLSGDVAHYVLRVHRLGAGDEVQVFDPEARLVGTARLLSVEGRTARVRVSDVCAAPVPSGPALWLFVGLAKGEKPDRVLRDATALGVAGVHWLDTKRSVPELGERLETRRERWRQITIDAARQSGRPDLPRVEGPSPLPSAWDGARGLRVLLHPEAPRTLARVFSEAGSVDDVSLAVGPEGGFDLGEIEGALGAGFVCARLAAYTLRAEVAATAALAASIALLAGGEPSP